MSNDDGNKLHRKFKPAELLKANKVDKPLSKAYFAEVNAEQKAGQVISLLV